MTTPLVFKLDNASDEQCTEELKSILRQLAEKNLTCAVIMARTETDLIVLVAGQHGEIEEVISDAMDIHAKQQPDEHERLEHFLTVGLDLHTVREHLSQLRSAMFQRRTTKLQ